MKFCKEFLKKTVLKNYSSKFSRSRKSVAELSFFTVILFARRRKQFAFYHV